MAGRITEVLDQIEAQQSGDDLTTIPDDMSLVDLANAVVRGKIKLPRDQLRLLIEMLPFHMPKLSAMAVSQLTGEEFARALDRAIERSSKVINARPLALPPPSRR